MPNWLAALNVPLFVGRQRLLSRRTFPRARTSWALDSGGFNELRRYGGWRVNAITYAHEVRRFRDEIGQMEWASQQDWMVEPDAVRATGLTVSDHIDRTVVNFLELREVAPDLPWVPVLQGWELRDYLRCWELYERCGVQLDKEALVGLGSVCRRQGTTFVLDLVGLLASQGLRLHTFGAKTTGLKKYHHLVASADSMAWSYDARRLAVPAFDDCVGHKNCANCAKYAEVWRLKLLVALEDAA